jgi:hypothetical protein
VRPTVLAGAAVVPDSAAITAGTGTVSFTPVAAGPLSIRIADDFGHATVYGTVTVTAGPAYRLIASPPAAPSISAGDSLAIHATVLDAFGNVVTGTPVSASVVAGTGDRASVGSHRRGGGRRLHAPRRGVAGTAPRAAVRFRERGPRFRRADSVLVTVVPGRQQCSR